MATYQKTFIAPTAEEAKRLAEEYKATLDFMRQPSIYGPKPTQYYHEQQGYFATVEYWGLD